MNKFILLTLTLFALLTTGAFAQQERMGRKTAEQRTELMTKNLTQKLALTPEQIEQVREIILKREKLRDAGVLSKEKQKAIHKDLNKVLTAEQQKIWKEARDEKTESTY